MLIPLGVQRLGGTGDTGFPLSALGAGHLPGAPVVRPLLDRVRPGSLLARLVVPRPPAVIPLPPCGVETER